MVKLHPKVVAVIQARMGSHRLPGKVVLPLLGRSTLEWMVRAANESSGVDQVVVATSTDPGDDTIADVATNLGVRCVRGSEDDVLSRFIDTLNTTEADAVVRLTADCPLVDARLIAQVVAVWRADTALDYVATTLVRTLPRGLDVELASASALRIADREATGHHRTHVTSYLYAGPRAFDTLGLVVNPPANDLRVTLDTEADAELLQIAAERLGDRSPSWREVVELLRQDKDLVAINAEVRQKSLEEG